MKLYARTLLFFLGAIAFQALLTAGLIVGLISRNNQNIARAELRQESVLVYDNYNSWIRAMWKAAIRVRDDASLKDMARNTENRADEIRLSNAVEFVLHDSGIDSFVIRSPGWDHFEIISDAYPFIDDFRPFVLDRDHPYLSVKSLNGFIFIVASVNLTDDTSLFLLKNIDDDFYRSLITRENSKVFVSSDRNAMWNTVGIGVEKGEAIGLDDELPPYREVYDIDFGRGHYNVSLQNLGNVEGIKQLKLLVFMSTEPYFELLERIGRIVLLVSLVTALVTAGVVLMFTRRLTRPIQDLAQATEEVRRGNLAVSVPEEALSEVHGLLTGFNSMVRHLADNKITLDANLKEITFLKDYNETIIHSLRAGILVVNRESAIEKANNFYREFFSPGKVDPVGKQLKDLIPSILAEDVMEAVTAVITGEDEPWSKIRREEDSVWEIKVYPLGDRDSAGLGRCVIEMDDISTKVDLEQKILLAERLASLNLLSAGIAHEINNPLSTILSNAQMLRSKHSDGAEAEALEWIEKETRRIADIVGDLRSFSLSGKSELQSHDLFECVEEVVRLTRYGIPSEGNVEIILNPSPHPMMVALPKDELRQAVFNILQNAIQALEGPGLVTLSPLEPDSASFGVAISDDGPGIPANIRSRIFDPFFTTKGDGIGTGLGLSIVYGIMKKYGGDVSVKSRDGRGTTFTLTMPRCEDES